jgi:hypothetical protein
VVVPGQAELTAWLEVRILPGPPRIPTSQEISRQSGNCRPNGRLVDVISSLMASLGIFRRCFVALISAPKIRFPGNRDFGSKRQGSNADQLLSEGASNQCQYFKMAHSVGHSDAKCDLPLIPSADLRRTICISRSGVGRLIARKCERAFKKHFIDWTPAEPIRDEIGK